MRLSAFTNGMVLLYVFACSCTMRNPEQSSTMTDEKQIHDELVKITVLLHDTSFALEVAANQEASYYTSNGEQVPAFLPPGADTSSAHRSIKDEKIATSIAPFYALECGIGALIAQEGGTPVEWMKRLLEYKLDSAQLLLLNRFAYATWKAGQPFRGLERLTRDVFMSASLLSQEEVQKDYDQLHAAATQLLPAMQSVKDSSLQKQLLHLKDLLKSKTFTEEMATHIAAAYHVALKQPVPLFFEPGDEVTIKKIPLKDEKIATNIAGFYALECGLSYLASSRQLLPSKILHLIVTDSLTAKDKILFERFANATWKAGQPFRGLARIERETFTCFDLLPQYEVEKDWVQIQTAAKKLSEHWK